MDFSTKSIINVLPLEEEEKVKLIESLDHLSPDKKFDLERLLWRAYRQLYQIKLDTNLQLAFKDAYDGKEQLDTDFYKRVQEKTEKEMDAESVAVSQTVDLTAARKAMQLIIQEIRAAKKPL